MNIAIMQPYFLPYIGYWQLIKAVDIFVIYDDIQYTKKGWINRDKYLTNNSVKTITVNVQKSSSGSLIREINISQDYDRLKIIRQFENAYKHAPHFTTGIQVFERIINFKSQNLFNYIFNSIENITVLLELKNTTLIRSSDINYDRSKTSTDRVLAICKELNTKRFINPFGGLELYKKEFFESKNLELLFLKSNNVCYPKKSFYFIPIYL